VARMAGRCQRSQHGRTHQDRSWSPIESKNTLNSEGEGAKSGLVWVERERPGPAEYEARMEEDQVIKPRYSIPSRCSLFNYH
jgi:hypothetical protein